MMHHHLLRIEEKQNNIQQLHCQQRVMAPADLTRHVKGVS